MTPKERERRWKEIDLELVDLWDGKVCRDTDPATREEQLLAEQDQLEYEEGDEWFRQKDQERRCVQIVAPDGFHIATLDEWGLHAPPKKKDRHWHDYRSAKENARAWLRDGPFVPEEVFRLLESRSATRGFWYSTALPEHVICLDDSDREHRNSDTTVIGNRGRSKIVIDLEAKADEAFGKQTIGEALAVGWKKNEAYARGGPEGELPARSCPNAFPGRVRP